MNQPQESPSASGFSLNRILLLLLPTGALLAIAWYFFGVMDGMTMLSAMGQPELAPVTGKVIFNGEPLKDGTIFFQPGDRRLRESIGVIKNGEYSLMTDVNGEYKEGAFVGPHRVKIEAVGPPIPAAASPLLTPRKYASYKDSGLTAEVTLEGPNAFDFEMVGEPGGASAPPPPPGAGGPGGGGGPAGQPPGEEGAEEGAAEKKAPAESGGESGPAADASGGQ